jgi:hypothetical protein
MFRRLFHASLRDEEGVIGDIPWASPTAKFTMPLRG